MKFISSLCLTTLIFSSCVNTEKNKVENNENINQQMVQPVVITQAAQNDTDDPAIWINPNNPDESLILGTDKHEDGALYVYNLKGEIIEDKVVRNLKRPNNVDILHQVDLGFATLDLAFVSERFTSKIRVYSLPSMEEIAPNGIPVFEGETGAEFRDLMGISSYKNPTTGKAYVIIGRKNGPKDGSYLWQYEILSDTISKIVKLNLVRKFGNYSGKKEIEAIAVDQKLGYIYYSDEHFGVRKYYADPEKGNDELAAFGTEGFFDDQEGISIYELSDTTGYIIVSDQGRNAFRVFAREGTAENPHEHTFIASIPVKAVASDGNEVTHLISNAQYPGGLFVAMSDEKTFHFYSWKDFAGDILKTRP